MDQHTEMLLWSARKIRREEVSRQIKDLPNTSHVWHPDDGRPYLGVNEGPDKSQNPYVVLRNVTYNHRRLKPIKAKAGTTTDLGSIPWLLKVIPGFRPTEPGKRAFLMHDVGYRQQLAERLLLDAIMHSALIADGMKRWKADACYVGVRLGGWVSYNRYAAAHRAADEHGDVD